jgi:hypothetical protein
MTNVHHTVNIMFKAYKEVGMEFETDKWIGFVSDNGPDIEIWLKHNVLCVK